MVVAGNTQLSSVFVGDLHPCVTERMLMEMFSHAGRLLSIRLCRDKFTSASLGYAYINFMHRADAERAIHMFHYELLMGQPMRVVWFQSDPSLKKNTMGSLFIRHLDKSIDSTALFDTFSCFGKVLSCKVVPYKTGSSGYGYVQFETAEAAEQAKEKLDGKLLNDRQVVIEHFKTRGERKAEPSPRSQPFTNTYIKHLNDDVDDAMLRNLFSKFGPVASVRVIRDGNGKSKGFGFVRFEKHEDAQKAIEEMDGKELSGKCVHVSRAQSKPERHSQFSQGVDSSTISVPGQDSVPATVTVPNEDSVPGMVTVPAELVGADPEANVEAEAEATAETEADVEAELEDSAETEADVEAMAETEADVEAESEDSAETEADVEDMAETEADVKAMAETEADVEAESEDSAETEADVEAMAETEADVEAMAETEADVEAESEDSAETEADVEAMAETEADVEAESEDSVETEADVEAVVKASAENEAKGDAEELFGADTKAEADVEAEAEAIAESEANVKAESEDSALTKADVEAVAEAPADAEAKAEVDAKPSEPDALLNSEADSVPRSIHIPATVTVPAEHHTMMSHGKAHCHAPAEKKRRRERVFVDTERPLYRDTFCTRYGTGYRHPVQRWPTSQFTGKSHKLVLPTESPNKKFVFIVGDSHLRSIVDGYVKMPEGQLAFGAMSTPGAHAAQLRTEVLNTTLPRTPDAVCLLAPSNNLTASRTFSAASEDFRKLLNSVCSSWPKVFVLDFPPRLNIDVVQQDCLRQEFKRVAAQKGVEYVSIAEHFPRNRLDLWCRDGVHLSDKGGMKVLVDLLCRAANRQLNTTVAKPVVSHKRSPPVTRHSPTQVVKEKTIMPWAPDPTQWPRVGDVNKVSLTEPRGKQWRKQGAK